MTLVAERDRRSAGVELTLADLAERFGPLPPNRIRMVPRPGTATEADVIRINERKEGLCELIDGILLEKTVGWYESYLGIEIAGIIREFVKALNLGITLGEQAMIRLWPGRIRLPDCCYLSWERMKVFPDTNDAAINMGPDLAVEVISPNNTHKEMQEKLEDYFTSGVVEVWYVYPTRREIHVFSAVDRVKILDASQTLDGGKILPGFSLELAKLFEEPRQGV